MINNRQFIKACGRGDIKKVYEYFRNENINAVYGLYEACRKRKLKIVEIIFSLCEISGIILELGFQWACFGGDINIIKLFIEKGPISMIGALPRACDGGHEKAVIFLIELGVNDLNLALLSACERTNVKIINILIQKGATNLNEAVSQASFNNNLKIVKLLISKGATNYNEGLRVACLQGNINDIKMMIQLGAKNFVECFKPSYIRGDINIIRIILYYIYIYKCTEDNKIGDILKYKQTDMVYIQMLFHTLGIKYTKIKNYKFNIHKEIVNYLYEIYLNTICDKIWTPNTHLLFPINIMETIKYFLLIANRISKKIVTNPICKPILSIILNLYIKNELLN
jgi:hypothetical protein